jgi:hypothetical protein
MFVITVPSRSFHGPLHGPFTVPSRYVHGLSRSLHGPFTGPFTAPSRSLHGVFRGPFMVPTWSLHGPLHGPFTVLTRSLHGVFRGPFTVPSRSIHVHASHGYTRACNNERTPRHVRRRKNAAAGVMKLGALQPLVKEMGCVRVWRGVAGGEDSLAPSAVALGRMMESVGGEVRKSGMCR